MKIRIKNESFYFQEKYRQKRNEKEFEFYKKGFTHLYYVNNLCFFKFSNDESDRCIQLDFEKIIEEKGSEVEILLSIFNNGEYKFLDLIRFKNESSVNI